MCNKVKTGNVATQKGFTGFFFMMKREFTGFLFPLICMLASRVILASAHHLKNQKKEFAWIHSIGISPVSRS